MTGPPPKRTNWDNLGVLATTVLNACALWNLTFVIRATPWTHQAPPASYTVALYVALVLALAACASNIAACARGWRTARGGWRWFVGAASGVCAYLGLYTGWIAVALAWLAGRIIGG